MQPLEQTQLSGTDTIGPALPDLELPLQRIYACEHETPTQPLFTQPVNNGELLHWTWATTMQEVRRISAWLDAQHFPPGSNIVIVSKNCAWWFMADFAIWMSGHVSVPFFPTARDMSLAGLFRHCQPVAAFIGLLENPLPLNEDVFQDLPFVAFPNCAAPHKPKGSSLWSDIIATQSPRTDSPTRPATDIATIIYTSGTTGQPKGAVHNFRALSLWAKSMLPAIGPNPNGGSTASSPTFPSPTSPSEPSSKSTPSSCRSTSSSPKANPPSSPISFALIAPSSSPSRASTSASSKASSKKFTRRNLIACSLSRSSATSFAKKSSRTWASAKRASSAPAAQPFPSTSSSGTKRWASTLPKVTV